MNKQEFLSVLKDQLEGTMDPGIIAEHIRYYDQYITGEIMKGKSEEQVMEELGSPVFIAKTQEDVADNHSDYYKEEQSGYTDAGQYTDSQTENASMKEKIIGFLMNPRTLNWLIPIVLILAMFVFFIVVGAAAAILFRFFAPIMLIILIVMLFKNSRNQ